MKTLDPRIWTGTETGSALTSNAGAGSTLVSKRIHKTADPERLPSWDAYKILNDRHVDRMENHT